MSFSAWPSQRNRGRSVDGKLCHLRIRAIRTSNEVLLPGMQEPVKKNLRNQSYDAQQARGLRRKIRLIRDLGHRCKRCGYERNLAALEFHHSDPAAKLFSLDLRSLSNRSWQAIAREALKCELLCSNCHKETHNPHLNGFGVSNNLQGKCPPTARTRTRH